MNLGTCGGTPAKKTLMFLYALERFRDAEKRAKCFYDVRGALSLASHLETFRQLFLEPCASFNTSSIIAFRHPFSEISERDDTFESEDTKTTWIFWDPLRFYFIYRISVEQRE